MQLHQVYSVKATKDALVYLIEADITDNVGESSRVDYVSRPDDPYGLNPTFRQWLTSNEGAYTIEPYVEPVFTPEEIRARMPALTSRQFWMAAANIDIDKDGIVSTVKAAMPDSVDRKMTIAELEASTFERTNPTVAEVMALLDIPAEQVDALWTWAADL